MDDMEMSGPVFYNLAKLWNVAGCWILNLLNTYLKIQQLVSDIISPLTQILSK